VAPPRFTGWSHTRRGACSPGVRWIGDDAGHGDLSIPHETTPSESVFRGRGLKSGREALAGIAADEDGGELLPGCGSDHTYWSSGSPMGFRWCCGSLLGRSETLQTRVTRCSTRASSGRSSSWGTSERSYSVIITGTDSCLGANGSSSRLSGLIPRHAGIRLGTPGLSDLVLRARFDSIARMR
jgi:hypothetical protein